MNAGTRTLLRRLFDVAVAAAHPRLCLPGHLPPAPSGRLIVLSAGKAGASMAAVAAAHYRAAGVRPEGLAVTRHGYGEDAPGIEVIEAGHPVPDAAGLAAAGRALALARSAGPEDLVLVLLSGGGSANWVAPPPGLSLPAKQALTRALLRSGAGIGEINTVRKHLSVIKGGRLAAASAPARCLTLAISDVPGDDPGVVASGPTVPDPTTLAEARGILARRGIEPGPAVAALLADPASESPKPGDPAFARTEFRIVARPADAIAAVAREAAASGYDAIVLGADLEGEAREVAAAHAAEARALAAAGRRAALISGGELTVTFRPEAGRGGRGGPNQEYALALALALQGDGAVSAVAGDTDGTDGGAGSADDPAGAFVDGTTLARAAARGLDPGSALAAHDSTTFFASLGDLLAPGPTRTNVNDCRILLIG